LDFPFPSPHSKILVRLFSYFFCFPPFSTLGSCLTGPFVQWRCKMTSFFFGPLPFFTSATIPSPKSPFRPFTPTSLPLVSSRTRDLPCFIELRSMFRFFFMSLSPCLLISVVWQSLAPSFFFFASPAPPMKHGFFVFFRCSPTPLRQLPFALAHRHIYIRPPLLSFSFLVFSSDYFINKGFPFSQPLSVAIVFSLSRVSFSASR